MAPISCFQNPPLTGVLSWVLGQTTSVLMWSNPFTDSGTTYMINSNFWRLQTTTNSFKEKKNESDSSWKLVAIFNKIAWTLSNTKLQVNKTELCHTYRLLTLLYMQQLNKTIFYLLTKIIMYYIACLLIDLEITLQIYIMFPAFWSDWELLRVLDHCQCCHHSPTEGSSDSSDWPVRNMSAMEKLEMSFIFAKAFLL